MDQSAKNRVKDALLASLSEQVSAIDDAYDSERSWARDQESVTAVDDISQSDEAGDLAGLAADAAEAREAERTRAEELDFTLTDTVRPGAIVGFAGGVYVVGVVASSFDADGVSYEGISSDSPAFEAISGLSAGDTFTVNDRQQTIDSVN